MKVHRKQDAQRGSEMPVQARVLDGCTVACLLLGETLGGWVLPPSWTILWFSPLLVAGLAAALLRHAFWPRPSLLSRVVAALQAFLSGPAGAASRAALLSRVLVLAVGAYAVLAIGYSPHPAHVRVSTNVLLDLPARHDAGWYLAIARHGYGRLYLVEAMSTREQRAIAFFPVYPALMRVGGDLVTIPAKVLRDPQLFGGGDARVLWGGVFVSIVCFVLAVRRVRAIALLDTADPAIAWRAVLLLCAYPFALFFSVPYSESAFLLALSSAVLAWRQAVPVRAAAWGLITGLTRSNGWTLSLALLFELVVRLPRERPPAWRWGVALCPAGGAALFSLYVHRLTGSALEWAHVQEAWGRRVEPLAFITRRWQAVQELGLAEYVGREPVDAVTLVCTGLVLGTAAIAAWERRWLAAALIGCYLAPALLIDLPATGRMTAVLFPVFIVLATHLGRTSTVVLAVIFGAGQAYLAARFFLWMTPY